MTFRRKDSETTRRQILEFVQDRHAQTGVFPSVREIALHMDFRSTNTVDYHLRQMEEDGLLERNERKARSFRMGANKPAAPRGRTAANPTAGRGAINARGRAAGSARPPGVPLVGRVAAGEPILAEENFEDYLNMENYFRTDEDTYALAVRGDSMIDAGICDGDVVIVRQQANVANGEIAVAVVNEEATVKRIYDDGKSWRLEPENKNLSPIIVRKSDNTFRLAGKVVGVMRKV